MYYLSVFMYHIIFRGSTVYEIMAGIYLELYVKVAATLKEIKESRCEEYKNF